MRGNGVTALAGELKGIGCLDFHPLYQIPAQQITSPGQALFNQHLTNIQTKSAVGYR